MGFFSSSSKTTTKTDPYAAAKGPMDAALGFMGSQPYMQAYGDPYAAAINPMLSGSLNQMYGAGQNMYGQMFQPGLDMMGRGMSGYEGQLSALQNRGPNQFRFDQGTYQQLMDNAMPGLKSAVDAQGKLSSMALQSNLGQLVSGSSGAGFGSNPLSKLGQGSAALQAQTALNNQNFAAGLYNNANTMATNAGMTAGGANMNALNANDSRVLGGYGNLANMGRGMAGMGLQGLNMGLKAGQMQQGLDQFGIDMARQQFMDRQTIPMQDAMARAQLSGNLGQAFGTTTSKTKSNPSGISKLGSIAGLAGSVFGMGGGLGGLSSIFGMGGGAGPQFGFGAGTANMSNPMDQWWMG
jgi:hypothetical protein